MVQGLKGEPGLLAWEIFNEPEGFLQVDVAGSGCTDVSRLNGTGAGWAGHTLSMDKILKYVNWSAAAIHDNDPGALVTVGSWSERPQTDSFGFKNYYSDECLRSVGGKSNGTLDFMQIHTYAWNGQWSSSSPINNSVSAYGLSKPLVVGEFNHMNGVEWQSGEYLYRDIYDKGYAGAWGWDLLESDLSSYLVPGMKSISGLPRTNFSFTSKPSVPNTCNSSGCTDIAPDSNYTCQQQASWGKCGESFM